MAASADRRKGFLSVGNFSAKRTKRIISQNSTLSLEIWKIRGQCGDWIIGRKSQRRTVQKLKL